MQWFWISMRVSCGNLGMHAVGLERSKVSKCSRGLNVQKGYPNIQLSGVHNVELTFLLRNPSNNSSALHISYFVLVDKLFDFRQIWLALRWVRQYRLWRLTMRARHTSSFWTRRPSAKSSTRTTSETNPSASYLWQVQLFPRPYLFRNVDLTQNVNLLISTYFRSFPERQIVSAEFHVKIFEGKHNEQMKI